MKDVIKFICYLFFIFCELSVFKNCVIRNVVGEEKFFKVFLVDVFYEVEFIVFKF